MANGLTYKRTTTSAQATQQLAETLAVQVRPNDVVVLMGDLAAGKTQFAQGVARGLGIQEPITSPTFNIQLDYEGGRLPLHHFDLYRIEHEEELNDIGFYETTESGGVSLIEWGDKFPGALPYSYMEIEITKDVTNPTNRVIYAHSYGESARQLLFLWAQNKEAHLTKTSK